MKIIECKTLPIEDIKVIKFARFTDDRGYFCEHYRQSDLNNLSDKINDFKAFNFLQANQSRSKTNVVRGLHFQWNPYMGKLVRTISGHMIDLVLDIRKNSPTLGKIVMYDMPENSNDNYNEWIWVPPGFAHGNCFLENTVIEYLCTGEYSPGCEAGISPLASDIDWSLADWNLKEIFDSMRDKMIITDKDRNGFTLKAWLEDERSKNFV